MVGSARGSGAVVLGVAAILLLFCFALLIWLAGPRTPEPVAPVSPEPAPRALAASASNQADTPAPPVRTTVPAADLAPEPRAGFAVRGRVMDSGTMQPIADARVIAVCRSAPQTPGTVDVAALPAKATQDHGAAGETITDDQGRFTFLGPWAPWTSLRVEHDGYAAGTRVVRASLATTGSLDVGDVLLDRERLHELRIVDEDGRPFGGAMAFVVNRVTNAGRSMLPGWEQPWSSATVHLDKPLARTTEDGHLVLPLSPLVYDVLLVHPEAAPTRLGSLGLLEARASGSEVRLQRGAPSTVGIVRASDLLPPVFDVDVSIRELQVTLETRLAVGDKMRCGALGLLQGKTFGVRVNAAGGRTAYAGVDHDFAAEPDLTVRVDACLGGLVTVHWDVAPQPAETIVLGLLRQSSFPGSQYHGRDYLFEEHPVPAGQESTQLHPGPGRYAVVAFSPSRGFWRSHWFALGPEDVDLHADRWTGTLHQSTIHVCCADGSPVFDCRLELSYGGGNPAWPPPLKILSDVSQTAQDAYRPFRLQLRSDHNGECTVSGLPEGSLTLVAAAPGMGEARVEVPRVVPELRIVLEPACAIRGSVRSGLLHDLFLAQAYVTLAVDDAIGGPTSPIDEEGRFAFDGLSKGQYVLRLVVPELASLGGALRLRSVLHRHWELARTPVQVMAGKETAVDLVVDDKACAPSMVLRLGAVTSGKVDITELLGPLGNAGFKYEVSLQQQDSISIQDLNQLRHLVRVTTAAGEAWTIVPISDATSEVAVDLERPRRIEWSMPRAEPGKYRLVPCTADGSSWAGCAGVPVGIGAGGMAAADAVLSGAYLLQADRGGFWKLVGRLHVQGNDVEYEQAAPR